MVIMIVSSFVQADYSNFPAKSINLSSAFSISNYWGATSEAVSIGDAHPVHGTKLSGGTLDGYYAVAGKGDNGENGIYDGFLVLLTPSGTFYKSWSPGINTENDALNAVVQISSGGDLLVVGYQTSGGVSKRSITRLDMTQTTSAAQEVWTITNFGDASGSHGAWEMINLNHDGTSILVCGVHQMSANSNMAFKSYGNVDDGNAIAMEIPMVALSSATTSSSATWTKTWSGASGFTTAKSIRPIPGNGVVVMTWGENNGDDNSATLHKFDSTRATVWENKKFGRLGSTAPYAYLEGTDFAVSEDGSYYAVSGHGSMDDAGEYYARAVGVNAADGTLAWSKGYMSCDYTQYPTCKSIKNECWGIATGSNFFVLSCGTGIENCDGLSGSLLTSCNAGQVSLLVLLLILSPPLLLRVQCNGYLLRSQNLSLSLLLAYARMDLLTCRRHHAAHRRRPTIGRVRTACCHLAEFFRRNEHVYRKFTVATCRSVP